MLVHAVSYYEQKLKKQANAETLLSFASRMILKTWLSLLNQEGVREGLLGGGYRGFVRWG